MIIYDCSSFFEVFGGRLFSIMGETKYAVCVGCAVRF